MSSWKTTGEGVNMIKKTNLAGTVTDNSIAYNRLNITRTFRKLFKRKKTNR
jgi:hypothetical protein